MRLFFILLRRDLALAARNRSEIIQAVGFFLIVMALFPLASGADAGLLKMMAGGILLIAMLFSSLLLLHRLYQLDHDDESLDQLRLQPGTLELLVLAKCFAHWIAIFIPLLLALPLAGMLYAVQAGLILRFLPAAILASLTMVFINSLGASLTLGLRRSGVLVSLLVMPLHVPALIFAGGAMERIIASPQTLPAEIILLLAQTLIILPLSIFFSAAAIRAAE